MPTVTQECGTDAVSKSATTPEARSFPLKAILLPPHVWEQAARD